MMPALQRDIARRIARHLILTFGSELEAMTITEVLSDELPGLGDLEFESLADLIGNYIEVANVEVFFQEWRIRDDGSIAPPEDVEHGEKINPTW